MLFPLQPGEAAGECGKGVFAAFSQGRAEQQFVKDEGRWRSNGRESVCCGFRPELARNWLGAASAAGGWRCPGGDTGWLADKYALVPPMTESQRMMRKSLERCTTNLWEREGGEEKPNLENSILLE
jgi:hypothetical protein